MYFDASGKLIDVSSSFSRVQGVLKPNEELGFKVRRSLGDYRAKAEELDAARSSSVKASISSFTIIK